MYIIMYIFRVSNADIRWYEYVDYTRQQHLVEKPVYKS